MLFHWSEQKQVFKTAAGGVALLGLLGAGTTAPVRAQTPTVSYSPEPGARQLIYSNNPEVLGVQFTDSITNAASPTTYYYYDLADGNFGAHSILQMTVEPGSYRDLLEHVNQTGYTLNYGVQIYNPSTTDSIFVTLVGKGYWGNAAAGFSTGGRVFSELQNNEAQDALNNIVPRTYRIYPGRTLWLLRSDVDYAGARPNTNRQTATGVVDFDLSGGNAVVSNIAYQNLRNTTSWSYPGYVTRTTRYLSTAATPTILNSVESRVYKGLYKYPGQTQPTGAAVTTTLAFTIDDSTRAGLTNASGTTIPDGTAAGYSELPIQAVRYIKNTGTGVYGPTGASIVDTAWWTGNSPSRESRAVSSDMFNIDMPGWGMVNALTLGAWPNTAQTTPNLGNYGVQYNEKITVTNNGQRDRTVHFVLNNGGGGSSSVAYLDQTGTWNFGNCAAFSATQNPPVTVTYFVLTVPAGQTRTGNATFIVGAPGIGTLRHAVRMAN